MKLGGWFKFHRRMREHPVWKLSGGQFKVWVTCLTLANHKADEWWDGRERIPIPAGSFITSQPHLADEAGVSRIVVRHALSNLGVLGSIRAKTQAKRWTLIEIVNWPIYQGTDEDVSQEESPGRAKDEPSASHNGRMKECKKKERTLPASGLTLANYLKKHTPEGQGILQQTVKSIASTRKSGKVAESVLDSLAGKMNRYPAQAVLSACRIYVAKNYAGEGKRESYLLGIVRGEAKRMNSNGRKPSGLIAGQDGTSLAPRAQAPKTQGQLAIDRALASMRSEQEHTR